MNALCIERRCISNDFIFASFADKKMLSIQRRL